MFRGSIYPIEAEEWMHRAREYFEIIDCEEDIKVKLVDTMFVDEAREWWFTSKKDLTKEGGQD